MNLCEMRSLIGGFILTTKALKLHIVSEGGKIAFFISSFFIINAAWRSEKKNEIL